jgi:hypothetical protein
MKSALQEAYAAVIEQIPVNLRHQCILIGGAALITIGRERHTDDVDFAISPEALHAFFERAKGDRRFTQNPDETWTYTCQANGINVEVEFLLAGGGFVPTVKLYHAEGEGFCAGLEELARMKAAAVCGRGDLTDHQDMKWILTRMIEARKDFGQVELTEEDRENLTEAAEELGGGEWVQKVVRLMGGAPGA